jgi:hypothetical protein
LNPAEEDEMYKITVWCLVGLSFLFASPSHAEVVKGRIFQESPTGQRSPVAYAEIIICNSVCQSTFSGSNGLFYFPNVPPARYSVYMKLGGTEFTPQPQLIEVQPNGRNDFTLLVPRR